MQSPTHNKPSVPPLFSSSSPPFPNPNQTQTMKSTPTTKTTTWVFTIFLLTSILVSAMSSPRLQLVGFFFCVAVLVVVVMARAAMVAWITVLVLLTFAGKRRRVLVHEGRKITADVAGQLVKVLWPPGHGGACNCC